MNPARNLYDLLRSYDDSDVSMDEFYAVWCEDISAPEAALLLNADPASATPDTFTGWGPGSDGTDDEDSGLLVGTAGTWTLLIGDHRCTEDEALCALSQKGRRALAVPWDINGDCSLKYAKDSQVVTVLGIFDTSYRSGRNPNALDAYLQDLRFNIHEHNADEPAIEPSESFTSALAAIGRVTGYEIDKAWLDSTHATYVVPADSFD